MKITIPEWLTKLLEKITSSPKAAKKLYNSKKMIGKLSIKARDKIYNASAPNISSIISIIVAMTIALSIGMIIFVKIVPNWIGVFTTIAMGFVVLGAFIRMSIS